MNATNLPVFILLEILQRVEALWKSAITTDLTVSEDVIQSLLLHGRVIHYCYTPFLFLPKWRMQVAATRDPYLATLYADELIEQGPVSILILIVCLSLYENTSGSYKESFHDVFA